MKNNCSEKLFNVVGDVDLYHYMASIIRDMVLAFSEIEELKGPYKYFEIEMLIKSLKGDVQKWGSFLHAFTNCPNCGEPTLSKLPSPSEYLQAAWIYWSANDLMEKGAKVPSLEDIVGALKKVGGLSLELHIQCDECVYEGSFCVDELKKAA